MQVYPRRYDPEVLVELWEREKVTFSRCVPIIVQMILCVKAAQDKNFKGWKLIIDGSSFPRALYDTALALVMLKADQQFDTQGVKSHL